MSKITWYEKPERITVKLVPSSTLSYDEALGRIAELEAVIANNGHEAAGDNRERALDTLRAVHASVSVRQSPANPPAKKRPKGRQRAPIDDSVKAIILRTKTTDDGEAVTGYVRTARRTGDTWYPVWTSARADAWEFSHANALDLVGWLKKSRMVDRSYTYSLEKIDA